MLEKCTRLSNPNLPSDIPWEEEANVPAVAESAAAGAESTAEAGDGVWVGVAYADNLTCLTSCWPGNATDKVSSSGRSAQATCYQEV